MYVTLNSTNVCYVLADYFGDLIVGVSAAVNCIMFSQALVLQFSKQFSAKDNSTISFRC